MLIHNDYDQRFIEVEKEFEEDTLSRLIRRVGDDKQNIIYCSSTAKAIEYALNYAETICMISEDKELLSLSREIQSQIHNDYYLVDLLKKGIAYHVGYLPSDIRMRIEELFRAGTIKTVFCTSTLIEGVIPDLFV